MWLLGGQTAGEVLVLELAVPDFPVLGHAVLAGYLAVPDEFKNLQVRCD